jgi:hypothetical protein
VCLFEWPLGDFLSSVKVLEREEMRKRQGVSFTLQKKRKCVVKNMNMVVGGDGVVWQGWASRDPPFLH